MGCLTVVIYPMHNVNILNIVNLQVLNSTKQSALSQGVHQEMTVYVEVYSRSQNSKHYEMFDLLSLPNSMCPKKLYSALKITSSSVARTYLTANDPSKSDQARAAASDLDADGKQSAKC